MLDGVKVNALSKDGSCPRASQTIRAFDKSMPGT